MIREDIKRPGLLYAGTEHGAHVSFDNGDHWQSLSLNLPDTQVADLVVAAQDLVIATHGRAFYVLDGIESLRQAPSLTSPAAAYLFEPGPAYRRSRAAIIDFFVPPASKDVALEVLDSDGRLLRRFTGEKLSTPGVNRVSWDLRTQGATVFPGMILRSANPARGPFVPPDTYRVRLSVDGGVQERPLNVLKDPRLTDVSVADLRAQYALARQVSDRTSQANQAVILIREIRKQIDERFASAKKPGAPARAAADRVTRKLTAIEEALYQVKNRSPKDPLNFPIRLNNRIAALQGVIEEADARPTQQSLDVLKELSIELDGLLARLEAVINTDLAVLNRSFQRVKVEPVKAR